MKRRDFLGGAAALIPAVASAQSSSLRDRVLGAWRILDAETVNVTTGASRPWLGRPRPYSGMIAYLPNGLMSVQIAAARPPARTGAGFGTLSADEKIAYADTGITLVRAVSFENDVLTLRTVDLLKGSDGDTFNQLTWARL